MFGFRDDDGSRPGCTRGDVIGPPGCMCDYCRAEETRRFGLDPEGNREVTLDEVEDTLRNIGNEYSGDRFSYRSTNPGDKELSDEDRALLEQTANVLERCNDHAKEILNIIDDMIERLNARVGTTGTCPRCNTGTVVLRNGRHGSFQGCSNFPKCRWSK